MDFRTDRARYQAEQQIHPGTPHWIVAVSALHGLHRTNIASARALIDAVTLRLRAPHPVSARRGSGCGNC